MKGKTSDDKDEEGDNAGPPGEAMVSMIICMIILTIFFIFFCHKVTFFIIVKALLRPAFIQHYDL